MVRRSVYPLALVAVALIAARPAAAAPARWTGNAEVDFPITPDGPVQAVRDAVGDVRQDAWITQQGWQNGWDIKDIRFLYDQSTDMLYVGVNFLGVAGNADGNPNANGVDPRTLSTGGVNEAHFGGDKTLAISFAPDAPGPDGPVRGTPAVIVGIPTLKDAGKSGLESFTVARYLTDREVPDWTSAGQRFGKPLSGHEAQMLTPITNESPDFLFSLSNFSKILDPNKGIWVHAFAGSAADRVAGEETVVGRVPRLAPQVIPEPSTILAWAGVVAGATCLVRRRRVGAR